MSNTLRRIGISAIVVSLLLFALPTRSAAAPTPSYIALYGSALDLFVPLVLGSEASVGGNNLNVVGQYCGSDSLRTAKALIVFSPKTAHYRDRHIFTFGACSESATSRLGRLQMTQVTATWVAQISVLVTVSSDGLATVRALPETYVEVGTPTGEGADSVASSLDRSQPLPAASITLASGAKLASPISIAFDSSDIVLGLGNDDDPTLISAITDARKQIITHASGDAVALMSELLLNQWLSAAASDVNLAPNIGMSNISLHAGDHALIISGAVKGATTPKIDATSETTWTGDPLALQSIILSPNSATCSAAEFSCQINNAANSAVAGVVQNVITKSYKGTTLRPQEPFHDYPIASGNTNSIARFQIDGLSSAPGSVVIFGSISVTRKPG